MPRTARNIVEEALTKKRADSLWTANYLPVLPMTPQDFDIGALLPAMLYMARWGQRRGKGKFIETFGQREGKNYKPPTIADVVKHLASTDLVLKNFNEETGQSILGDLLLTYCLENTRRALGHSEPLLRVFPTHYLSSWLDLPKEVSHLRGVPELLAVLLAQQETNEWLEPSLSKRPFKIGAGFKDDNALLNLFGRQMIIHGQNTSNLASDFFVEEEATEIGIDELLIVRTAQACNSAPLKASGGDAVARIANRWPTARCAAQSLREDLSVFIEAYGSVIPRQAFLQILEAGIALGLTSLMLSTAQRFPVSFLVFD